MFKCCDCLQSFRTSILLIQHLKSSHVKLVEYECKQIGCNRVFGETGAYKKHIDVCYCKPTVSGVCSLGNSSSFGNQMLVEQDIPNGIPSISNLASEVLQSSKTPETDSRKSFSEQLSNSVLIYVASLYSVNTIPRCLVQNIIEMNQNLLCSGLLLQLKNKVLSALSCNSIMETKEIVGMFDQICSNMFHGLDTEYRRFETFKKCGAFIYPESYNIVPSLNEKELNSDVILDPIMLTGHYIPMAKCLKAFLELPNVISSILKYMGELGNKTTVIENIVQGDLWKNVILPKFSGKIVLPLNYYFDEYDPDNVLGSHAGVHKLGNGFFEISCMPPEFQSALENKFLANIFHACDRSAGNYEVFRPVVNMLKSLEEEGITVVVGDKVYQVYFALTLVVGDNLGLHGMLGFVEGFTANFPCIICRSPLPIVQTQLLQVDATLRNVENYVHDVAIDDSSITGVKENCIFNALNSYHVCENVYVDLMHDIAEGVVNYDMCSLIYYLTRKQYFDYDVLNNRAQGFFYGPAELGNKPPLILQDYVDKEHLKMSASEMLCFVRYFGLIVGDLIPCDDSAWEFYKCLLSILDIVCAPSVTLIELKILKSHIASHHSMYIDFFQKSLKPKHHYLVHYPYVMKCIGPVSRVWCMRWESKHRESKQYAYVSCNRLDLPQSISIKNQLKFCYRLVSNKGFETALETSIIDFSSLYKFKDFNSFAHVVPDQYYVKCPKLKWVSVNGTKYHTGSVVVYDLDDFFPVFGIIHAIVYDETSKDVNFILKLLKTISFDEHFHAYLVKNYSTSKWKFTKYCNLVTPLFSCIRKVSSEMYVTWRHIL